MPLRVKDYAGVHQTDFDHGQRGDSKEFDRIASVCVMRATEALKSPIGPYTKMHCNQIGDIFRSMVATQRGIRRMLDFEGPIDPETVDALPLARLQLEGLFSLCPMLEDPKYVTAYVQDHWRKQYVEYLMNKEETKLLPRYQPLDTPALQRLVMLGQQFGIVPAAFTRWIRKNWASQCLRGWPKTQYGRSQPPARRSRKSLRRQRRSGCSDACTRSTYICAHSPTDCRKRTSSRISSTVDSQTEDLFEIRK
jgi:hypothetical protein